VAHYKLDDPYMENTTNLVSGVIAGGCTTVNNQELTVTTTGQNSDTYF
jgi:hypothetical protein